MIEPIPANRETLGSRQLAWVPTGCPQCVAETHCPVPCPPPVRGSGRTTWMIDRLIESIRIGQPRMIVVGLQSHHCQILFEAVWQRLQEEGFVTDSVARNTRIRILNGGEEDQNIRFMTAEQMRQGEYTSGLRGWAEFWDHYADGEQ